MNNFENIVIVCFIYYYTWLTCHWRPLSSASGSRHQSIFNQNIHVYGIIRPAIYRNVMLPISSSKYFIISVAVSAKNLKIVCLCAYFPSISTNAKMFWFAILVRKTLRLAFLSKKDKKLCTKKGFFKSKIITCISAWVQTYVVEL